MPPKFEHPTRVTQFTLYVTRETLKDGCLVRSTNRRLEDGAIIRRHIDQLQERLSSSQVVSPGLPGPLEMTFPHGRAESLDEPLASQPVQLSSQMKPSAPSQPTDILPTLAPVVELRRASRFRKQPERLDLC